MNEDRNNIIQNKTYNFSLKIIELYKFLCVNKKEYILAKQFLRSGTSIGANVEEAIGGVTKKDFRNKIYVAYKEARETKYWIRLLRDSGYLEPNNADELLNDFEEIIKILGKIISTLNKNIYN
jgi:four helix bundle protein